MKLWYIMERVTGWLGCFPVAVIDNSKAYVESMKFKLKIGIISTLLCFGMYLSLHEVQHKHKVFWASINGDNIVQTRAQKSGEEINFDVKLRVPVTPPIQQENTSVIPKAKYTFPSANFLNSSKQLLPWIDRKIYMPNYFTSNLTEVERKVYKDSVIVYLHHNKAAGTTTKRCLLNVIPKTGKKLGPVLASGARASVSKRLSSPTHKDKYNVYMGGYSFGLCDDIKKPCSYFTIFRDPYHRSISSYSYCRRARSDQLCRAQNPWKVTLKEWAIHQGNFLFRQLLFHPKFCSEFKNNYKAHLLPHDIYGTTPCWFRQKVIMLDLLSKKQINALVDFCINNIETWFAVVGLTEEYNTSLAMLQQVYGIQFSSCSGSIQNTSGRYTNIFNSNNETSHDSYSQIVEDLMNDEEVQQALYADIRLYEKIKEIFYQQKEKMHSSIEENSKGEFIYTF